MNTSIKALFSDFEFLNKAFKNLENLTDLKKAKDKKAVIKKINQYIKNETNLKTLCARSGDHSQSSSIAISIKSTKDVEGYIPYAFEMKFDMVKQCYEVVYIFFKNKKSELCLVKDLYKEQFIVNFCNTSYTSLKIVLNNNQSICLSRDSDGFEAYDNNTNHEECLNLVEQLLQQKETQKEMFLLMNDIDITQHDFYAKINKVAEVI